MNNKEELSNDTLPSAECLPPAGREGSSQAYPRGAPSPSDSQWYDGDPGGRRVMFGTPEESNWLRNAVQLVREARCLAGRQAAIRVWGQLGLPDLHAPQRQLSASPRLDAIADESVQQWLSERTSSEDATARIKTADLWYDYSQWAAGQNIPAMPLSSFGKELTKIGVEKIMSNGSWCCGIALVDTPSDDG